jgi:hypothetical protein
MAYCLLLLSRAKRNSIIETRDVAGPTLPFFIKSTPAIGGVWNLEPAILDIRVTRRPTEKNESELIGLFRPLLTGGLSRNIN